MMTKWFDAQQNIQKAVEFWESIRISIFEKRNLIKYKVGYKIDTISNFFKCKTILFTLFFKTMNF